MADKKNLDKVLRNAVLGRSAKAGHRKGEQTRGTQGSGPSGTPTRVGAAGAPRTPSDPPAPTDPEAAPRSPEAGRPTEARRQETPPGRVAEPASDRRSEETERGGPGPIPQGTPEAASDKRLLSALRGRAGAGMREIVHSREVDAARMRDDQGRPRDRQPPPEPEARGRATPGAARDPDPRSHGIQAHGGEPETTDLPEGVLPPKDRSQPRVPQADPEMREEGFLARARSREEKARKAQAKEEARRMREEAKRMLKQAREKEKQQAAAQTHQERVSSVREDLGYDPARPITRIPPLPERYEEVAFRVIAEDRAFIRTSYDSKDNRYLYEVIEPRLTPNEGKIKDFLRDTLIRTLDGRKGEGADWHAYLREAVQQAIIDHDILVDGISTERILYYLTRDFLGYGPIDVLMLDEELEDISCDGPGIPIYIFHRKYESLRTNVVFEDDLEIDSFVIRLAQRSGKHISIADPLLDATLPDGSRLQATLSREVTSRGSSFTVRKFRAEPLTPPDLIDLGTISTPMAAYFWFLIEEGRSFLYAGGKASGKTTSLNAVSQFIPPEKKIVSIEDTREINLMHENWIAGITRSGFGGELATGKRAGTIDMYRLLEAALRQRPEYLIVGEVRGPEALTLFQAMATGHAVYSTMHADSAKSAVYRLENAPINVPRMMLQTLDIIAIQSQVRVRSQMARRVREVVEMVGFDPDTDDLLTNTVFYWDSVDDRHIFTGHSSVFDQIQDKKGWDDETFQHEWERRMQVLEWMRHKGIRHFSDVAKHVHEYYKRPDRLMARIAEDGFELDAGVAAGSKGGAASSVKRRAEGAPGAGTIPARPPDDESNEGPAGETDQGSRPPWMQAAAAMQDKPSTEGERPGRRAGSDGGQGAEEE